MTPSSDESRISSTVRVLRVFCGVLVKSSSGGRYLMSTARVTFNIEEWWCQWWAICNHYVCTHIHNYILYIPSRLCRILDECWDCRTPTTRFQIAPFANSWPLGLDASDTPMYYCMTCTSLHYWVPTLPVEVELWCHCVKYVYTHSYNNAYLFADTTGNHHDT